MIVTAIILGLVQGLTEFLPISSSAHIRIVSQLLGVGDWGAGFTAICQIGTETAVIIYFRKEIKEILLNFFAILSPNSVTSLRASGGTKNTYWTRLKNNSPAQLGWWIIIGSLPAIILGVLLKDVIKTDFRNLWLTAVMLISFGLILGIIDRYQSASKTIKDLNWLDAVLYGIGQSLALIPGVSRSGGTISAGRLMKYDRNSSARYAFLLAIPAVFGSGLFETVDVLTDLPANFPGPVPAIIAVLISFIVGYFVIIAFLRIVTTFSYMPFVIYRVALGVLVLGLLAVGVLTPL
ncbi:MAG: undecaprenyl-diphosphatase UppP [Bifidobacteriaceae bacterium]|jgi:undecaprenyl-diphosphatase|nr:undecaprenyl-diphosphatase UppP [Bifidobacteriaceae bacterium]